MSPFVACSLLPTSAVARCCWCQTVCVNVCVIPMPTKPLYTQFCPFPALLHCAPCRFILINFLSFSCHLACVSIFLLMSFRSRCAFYVCAICCNRCALDVLCLLHSSLLLLFLSSFIPCVIAFRPLTHLHCDTVPSEAFR
jgi:hypothetical protein